MFYNFSVSTERFYNFYVRLYIISNDAKQFKLFRGSSSASVRNWYSSAVATLVLRGFQFSFALMWMLHTYVVLMKQFL